MNCKNCNTADFVGTIFYPNLCIPCIIKAMEVMGFTKKPTLDDVEQIQQGIVNYKSDNS